MFETMLIAGSLPESWVLSWEGAAYVVEGVGAAVVILVAGAALWRAVRRPGRRRPVSALELAGRRVGQAT